MCLSFDEILVNKIIILYNNHIVDILLSLSLLLHHLSDTLLEANVSLCADS